MAEMEETSVPVLAVTAAVGAVVLLFVLLCGLGKRDDKKESEDEYKEKENGSTTQPKAPQPVKKQKSIDRFKKEQKHSFTHKWLAGSLKGHSSPILDLDFSPNGKYLASCAEDRSILLWNVKDFNQKEHKSVRVNVELDHATKVNFSPDNKALVLCLYNGNTVRVMKMGKKSDGTPGNFQTVIDFPKKHEAEILNIGISNSGTFIMTASKDTNIKIWDLKGEILSVIDTHQINNSYAAVSPCGRFVGSSGFTSDVKVWEVGFDKGGTFREVSRAFELKGHKAGVYSFAFNSNSTRMASVSKDGTWKKWDTNIEYQKGQEPYLLQTGKLVHSAPSLVAISPDGRTVAVATGYDLHIYNSVSGELGQSMENVHANPITCLAFDNDSKYLVSTGDKHIHVFHNIVGFKATIQELNEKRIKAPNQSARERIQTQIREAEEALQKLEEAIAEK